MKTVSDAINHNSPPLYLIKKNEGDVVAKAFISAIIADLVMYFNVGKTMNANQVVQVVELIQSDYYYLKPSELKYCFDLAKKGTFGQIYDRIDGAIIFDWIEKFIQKRTETVIIENERRNNEYKKGTASVDVLKFLDKQLFGTKEPIKKDTTIIERDNEIEGYFSEFDELFRREPIGSNGGKRFVNYNDKIVDQSEYVQLRLKEEKNDRL